MRRREFLTLVTGALMAGPRAAGAQASKVYRLGSLTPGKYRFQANGLDFKGEPLPVGTVVNLTVIEPFWKNPWLWGAGAGAGGVLLAALINRKISKARASRIKNHRRHREQAQLLEHQAVETSGRVGLACRGIGGARGRKKDGYRSDDEPAENDADYEQEFERRVTIALHTDPL